MEIRNFAAEELRIVTIGGARTILMSLKFNALSVPLGASQFRELIAPSAFDQTINDPNKEVLAYWSHNTGMPLGRRSRGTLVISRTATALKAEIQLGDTTWGRDAAAAIERGDVQGMSFRFRVPEGGDKWSDRNGQLTRTLTNIDLEEVSPTAEPAYIQSSADVRSAEESYMASQVYRGAGDLVADRLRRERLRLETEQGLIAARERSAFLFRNPR